jgi:hypothetical protein
MAARIEDEFMNAEYDGRVIATARYNSYAAADGQGAWAVPDHPSRLFSRNQAITAVVLAERLAAGTSTPPASATGQASDAGA